MRYLCLIFFLILSSTVHAQETLFDLMAKATPIPDGFETIFDLDVAKYYQLSGDYSKEPKKSEFKKTDWYRKKLAELKVIRDSMLRKQYSVHLIMKFNGNNYDAKRKGFDIELGSNIVTPAEVARAPRSVHGFLFKALPSRQEQAPGLPKGVYTEKLFLPMSEELGREIETGQAYADVFFLFTPSVREKTTFSYIDADSTWHKAFANNMKADKVRVVVAHTASGVLYYDKTFETPATVGKKD